MASTQYRIAWDASLVPVASLGSAHTKAAKLRKQLGLEYFRFERWNYELQKWELRSEWQFNEGTGRFTKCEEAR